MTPRVDPGSLEERLRSALRDRYTIHEVVGTGASATVYLATELQYDRRVAIKVLSPHVADSVSTERFLREIRIAARLSHPRIVPLLDSGVLDGLAYYMMPYVEGDSLRRRLEVAGPLSIRETVAIASQIASALDHAHDHGILHRDVKPGNILVQGSESYIADFGLALALEPTLGDRLSESSASMGTPRYMSPEQASGERMLDARTDVYSLGCVVYEMLAGEPPHTGHSLQALVARVLTEPPTPLTRLRDTVPEALDAVVRKALAKAPADRYPRAGAFAEALEDAAAGRVPRVAVPGAAWPRVSVRRIAGASLGAAVVVAAVVGYVAWPRRAADGASTYITVLPPDGVQYTEELRNVSAISPDGSRIVFAGTDSAGHVMLWIRSLSEQGARPLAGTEFGYGAFWSADGQSIGFFDKRGRRLLVVDTLGRAPRELVETTYEARGGSWGDDGTILFAPDRQTGISAVARDGAVRALTTPDRARGEIGHMWPQMLPGARAFLYYVASPADSTRGVYVATRDRPREGRRLVASPAGAIYAGGHLLYVRGEALVAQPFDARALTLGGRPVPLADSVAVSQEYNGVFSVSRSGRLLYASGPSRDISQLQWRDSTGAAVGAPLARGYIRNPSLARDGRRFVYQRLRGSDGHLDVVDRVRGTSMRLALDSTPPPIDPVLSPDGAEVAYVAEGPGVWTVYRKAVDRADAPVLVGRFPRFVVLTDWSPDGRRLLLEQQTARGDFDLVSLSLAPGAQPEAVAGGPGHQITGRVSADGRHVAYVSMASGEAQVYVQPFPGTGARCLVSTGSGWQPAWGRSRDRLYYLTTGGTVMRATLAPNAGSLCLARPPDPLFQTPIRAPGTARSHFDASAADGRFLVNAPLSEPVALSLTVIDNWPARLRAAR